MNINIKSRSWAVIFVFVFLVFAFSTPAQKMGPFPCVAADENPVAFPFDFSDKYYLSQGVEPTAIMGRRNGTDGLSVFDKNCDPYFSRVRVTVTVGAYDQNGQPLFWYPLGDLQYDGFSESKLGVLTRNMANQFPVYVFPDPKVAEYSAFANARQAPILDNSRAGKDLNPLGVRAVVLVNYTEKALGKEGVEMMLFFGKKNGYASDDTAIIKSLADIDFLLKNEFISMNAFTAGGLIPSAMQYAISPEITKKGAIAMDAFLWMATKDGMPLPAEEMFVTHFNCMKKTGDWCN